MQSDAGTVRGALDEAAEELRDRYYSRVIDEERYEFQVYSGTRRSFTRWEAVEGLRLWTIGPRRSRTCCGYRFFGGGSWQNVAGCLSIRPRRPPQSRRALSLCSITHRS